MMPFPDSDTIDIVANPWMLFAGLLLFMALVILLEPYIRKR